MVTPYQMNYHVAFEFVRKRLQYRSVGGLESRRTRSPSSRILHNGFAARDGSRRRQPGTLAPNLDFRRSRTGLISFHLEADERRRRITCAHG